MEAFQLLSKGGARFNKKRFDADIKLFSASRNLDKGKQPELGPDELPPELDFFRYVNGGSGIKRKNPDGVKSADASGSHDEKGEAESSQGKRRKLEENPSEEPTFNGQRVVSKGKNVPEPIDSFQSLKTRYKCSSLLLSNLENNGWTSPTDIQAHGIPMLMERRDIAAMSPTGTGKTLAYLLPIFALLGSPISTSHGKPPSTEKGKGVRALVLAPTRELAHQIHNECLKISRGRKWRITLYSKATATTLADKVVREKIDVVITTPMRIVASLRDGKMELDNVRHLVLDEADRILDPEFLSQIQEVLHSCTHPSLQKAVFSATLPPSAEKIAMDMLIDSIHLTVGLKDTPLPLIRQSLVYVADQASKLPSLVTYLTSTTSVREQSEVSMAPPPWTPPILIFTSTQPRATSLCAQLILHGIQNVDVLHASLTNKQREDVTHRMLSGECWVLVCTDIVARGMDFRGVKGVINYDWPQSVQNYIHRIGRTGRAGREGIAVTYWTDEDALSLKPIANVLLQSGSPVSDWMLKLPKPSALKKRHLNKLKRDHRVASLARIRKRYAMKRDKASGPRRRGNMEQEEDELGSDTVWSGFGAEES